MVVVVVVVVVVGSSPVTVLPTWGSLELTSDR